MISDDGKLTPEQAKLPERLEQPTIESGVPGQVATVDKDAIWVDENGACWIDKTCPLNQCGFFGTSVRIIFFDEGIVVDVTSIDDPQERYFDPVACDPEEDDISDYIPIVAMVSNLAELKKIEALYLQTFGRQLLKDGEEAGSAGFKHRVTEALGKGRDQISELAQGALVRVLSSLR